VRTWWETTSWYEQYDEDYIEVYYDYGSGAWEGRHSYLAPDPEELDDEVDESREHLALGDPADPPTGFVQVGDGMRPLDTATFLTEIETFRHACLDRTAAGELVDFLLDELLARPLERIGGPKDRMVVWADADETGEFWRTDGVIDVEEVTVREIQSVDR